MNLSIFFLFNGNRMTFFHRMSSRIFFALKRRIDSILVWHSSLIGRCIFFIAGVQFGDNLKLYGLPILSVSHNSRIQVGSNCRFRSTSSGNAIGVNHAVVLRTMREGAILKIGDSVGMSGGSICAVGSVFIGNRVMIGANTIISDSDFHPIDSHVRSKGEFHIEFRPVVIEDDVWIGADVFIGKGVTIGCSSVIGAKSVVTRDVPPYTIVAGNPAKPVRSLK